MKAQSNAALIASLVSKTSRAAILTILLDGRFHAAGELAYRVRIKPQTASFHLAKLVEADVVAVEKQGRHRYYGIRNQEVAQVMESLLSIAPPLEIRSLRQSSEAQALRYARTCYDHLAGQVGVQITQSLLDRGVLLEDGKGFVVTAEGEAFLASLQIDVDQLKATRRSYSHKCLDWSERRHHLAGAVGHALLEKWVALDWVQRLPETRALRITAAGEAGFKEILALELEE